MSWASAHPSPVSRIKSRYCAALVIHSARVSNVVSGPEKVTPHRRGRMPALDRPLTTRLPIMQALVPIMAATPPSTPAVLNLSIVDSPDHGFDHDPNDKNTPDLDLALKYLRDTGRFRRGMVRGNSHRHAAGYGMRHRSFGANLQIGA